MVRLNKNPHLRIALEVALALEEELNLVHPIVKRLFHKKVLPNLPLVGRLKHFHKNWELITRDPDILALIKLFKIPFLSQHVQDYVLRIPKMSKAQRKLVQAEIETMPRKGAISQKDHTQGEFINSLFLVEKKDGGQRPVITFKSLKFLRALRAIQNGKFKFTPVPPPERRLHGQAGFEGCLLLRTSPQGISKICSISMGWETLRVPLPLLQPGSCPTNIREIVEIASTSIEKVEYADHNLYRRHVNNWSNQKGGGVN